MKRSDVKEMREALRDASKRMNEGGGGAALGVASCAVAFSVLGGLAYIFVKGDKKYAKSKIELMEIDESSEVVQADLEQKLRSEECKEQDDEQRGISDSVFVVANESDIPALQGQNQLIHESFIQLSGKDKAQDTLEKAIENKEEPKRGFFGWF